MSAGILGGNVAGLYVIQITFDPASVNANTTAEQTVTVPGVNLGDFVVSAKPTHSTGLSIGNARVSAKDTVSVQLINNTGSSINAASETWSFFVVRPESNVTAAVSV